MSKYDVAVIMTARDEEKTIEEAITSVIKQNTDLRIVLVMIDDGSKDNTSKIMKEFFYVKKGTPKISFAICSMNHSIGQARARNFAEKNTQETPYLAFLDADDVWRPDHIESRINKIEESKADVVYGPLIDILITEEYGKVKATEFGRRAVFQPIAAHTDPSMVVGFEKYFLMKRCNIMLPSLVLMRRPLFRLAGGFPNVICGEDGVLWRRLAEAGRTFAYDPNYTVGYRLFKDQNFGRNQSLALRTPEGVMEGKHLIGDKNPNGQELDEEWRIQMAKTQGEDWYEKLRSYSI